MSDGDPIGPFAYREDLTRRTVSAQDPEVFRRLLEDEEELEVSESLAIWDLQMVATDRETEEMTADAFYDRLEAYPEDYSIDGVAATFRQDGDAPAEYEIRVYGHRDTSAGTVEMPPTRIAGRIEPGSGLDQELVERYGLDPEAPQRRSPHGPPTAGR